ncbi:MAG: methyltransferase [Candidatus Nanopelagicales bacterium]
MAVNIPILPDFTRIAWRTPVAKEWYDPLIRQFTASWLELERLSVAEGLRDAAWQFVMRHDLVSLTAWCAERDLVLIPVQETTQSQIYSSSAVNTPTESANAYRCVIVRREHYKEVLPFVGDEKIGRWLGYPECCRKHFAQTWGSGQVDSTYEQMAATDWTDATLSSTLWRWLGVRLVTHLPCSYSCYGSDKIARDFLTLGDKYGFVEDMALAKELLAMPVSLSRVFGINELSSPIAKIVTRTDWTPTMERAEKSGTFTPLSSSLWTFNGFTSAAGMRAGHAPLLSALVEHVPQGARVLDLGCGNGLLLRRLKQRRPDVKLGGIDHNREAVASIPPLTGRFAAGTIQSNAWEGWHPDVVVLNPVRLREMSETDATKVREALASVPLIVAYGYSDCADAFNAEGLGEMDIVTKLPHVVVGLIRRG